LETSYKVKIHGIEIRKGARTTTYRTSWKVDERLFRETFRTSTLAADSFRSELMTAARKGEPLSLHDGLPKSMSRQTSNPSTVSMMELVKKYADFKWADAAANSRSGLADALATAALALTTDAPGRPEPMLIRRVFVGWVCNTKKRTDPMPDVVAGAHRWLSNNMVPVTDLEDPVVLRKVLEQIRRKLDGKPAAAKTVLRKKQPFTTSWSTR
jgi:hypothetical protein